MEKNDIVETLKSRQKELEKLGIKRWELFGSFAQGRQTENSDIDLIVDMPEEGNLLEDVGKWTEATEYLEGILHRKVDLINYSSIKKGLLKNNERFMEHIRKGEPAKPLDYLLLIQNDIGKISAVLKKVGIDNIFPDHMGYVDIVYETLQDGVMKRVDNIGEQCGKMMKKFPDYVDKHKNLIDFKDLYSLRNKSVHHYDGIDFSVIKSSLINDLPTLKLNVDHLVKQELALEKQKNKKTKKHGL